jgi:hypothetical protein
MSWGPNTVYFHGGETPGYNSFMGYDPNSQMTLVVWTNLTMSLDDLPTANTPGESPRGIAPRGARRTVREPLDSYGSHHRATPRRDMALPHSSGSSHCWLAH